MLSLGVSVPALILVAVGLLTYVTLLVASLRRRSAQTDAEPDVTKLGTTETGYQIPDERGAHRRP